MLITSGSWWICLKCLKKSLYIESSQLRMIGGETLIIYNKNNIIKIVQKPIITYSKILFSGFDTFSMMP